MQEHEGDIGPAEPRGEKGGQGMLDPFKKWLREFLGARAEQKEVEHADDVDRVKKTGGDSSSLR